MSITVSREWISFLNDCQWKPLRIRSLLGRGQNTIEVDAVVAGIGVILK
jgi:hypothetical protein